MCLSRLRASGLAAGVTEIEWHAIAMAVVEAGLDARLRLDLVDEPSAHEDDHHDNRQAAEVLPHAVALLQCLENIRRLHRWRRDWRQVSGFNG